MKKVFKLFDLRQKYVVNNVFFTGDMYHHGVTLLDVDIIISNLDDIGCSFKILHDDVIIGGFHMSFCECITFDITDNKYGKCIEFTLKHNDYYNKMLEELKNSEK